ncbi:HNH endonuclease [Paenibacillus campi]|uniref:HNH endonuclease n=1 Tax=Paenibacillus campi TaxID=3106031 RepID=UPI002AFDCFA7|nr:HNH endonuclease [Paenibacillus sp. SGZ-1014]
MQHIGSESATVAADVVDCAPQQEHSADAAAENPSKVCSRCGQTYPLSHYLKRTGRKSGRARRRGTCRHCRKQLKTATAEFKTSAADSAYVDGQTAAAQQATAAAAPPSGAIVTAQSADMNGAETQLIRSAARHEASSAIVTARPVRSLPSIEASDIRGHGLDLSILRPTRRGIVHMRGRTDKGRRWHQETDLDTAVTLVEQYAAVVVNRHTIRRLYSNRSFRKYILERDHYTCYFCGGYGDTIDHLLPRARGGHTTPLNCVCACNLCNQAKADHDLHHFIQPMDTK